MRVAIATLGCKVNQYDSAVFERLFDEQGWRRVDLDQPADAYVVNTCTVTDRADSEARRIARRVRRRNPQARVILTGCYAQTNPAEIAELEYVDYVIGLNRVADLLRAVAGELEQRVHVSDLRRATEVETFGIETFPGRTRAFVKVQEGCNLFCTFCIIPVARGPSRSIPPRRVVDEIARLEGRGYREVVLTGIHLGGYGADLDPPCDLAFLLEAIAERRFSLRVRISSVDPPEITDRLLAVVADDRRFCRHFHVPVQAGDDNVLARMRRRYTADEAAEAFQRLRERLPGVTVGTDVITGFPGETAEEFERGFAWLERTAPDYMHIFPYSKRSATSAAKRWTPVAPATIRERARRLQALDRGLRRAHAARFVGKHAQVLFENSRDPATGLLRGYTSNYLSVLCNADDRWMNRIVEVEILRRRGDRLEGRIA